ncbi:uncharacterized protein LOC134680633 [Mytilus trossulus]|uniref:uncharacterized protein LOC134680633 n=1 Tax=Mytilus trossulus TaxID=6551 RepID=UPI003005E2B2
MNNQTIYFYWISLIFSILCFLSKGEVLKRPVGVRLPCSNGILDQFGTCSCLPCWTGDNCDVQVNNYAPEFTQYTYEVSINSLENDDITLFRPEVIDKDRIDTCGDNNEQNCPCADLFFSIKNENDGLFTINPEDGSISLSKGSTLQNGQDYRLDLSVRNVLDRGDTKTGKAIVILRTNKDWWADPINSLGEPRNNGYSHHIVKRATTAAPQNVTFVLAKVSPYDTTTDLYIGSRVKFRLDISFPVAPTDMLVELFTPDNDTTVMILCDIVVTKGSGLSITGSTDVTMESKTPGSVLHDRAIINLGTVTVNNCDNAAECTLVITYEAVMVDDTVQNGSIYWVSAGAEYNNANEVWVGQASFATITDILAITETPTFNFTGPPTFPIGSAAMFEVEMYLPYPSTALKFDSFSPLNASSVVSICSAKVKSIGDNFKCGLDESAISKTMYQDGNGLGNNIGHLDIGTIINKASRDASQDTVNSTIVVEFVAHMYKDVSFVGQDYWMGAAFEMGSTQIWAAQLKFTGAVAIDPSGMSVPGLTAVYSPEVNVDEPKVFYLDMLVPEGSTSTYTLTVQTPIDNNLPKFQLCKISLKRVGGNMPCVIPDDSTVSYESTVAATHADKGTLSLGSISDLPISPGNATENTITFEIIVTPLQHTAIQPSSPHDVTMTITYGSGATVSYTSTFTVQSTTAAADISNTTVPSFNMTYADGKEEVNVGAATKVYYDITTNRDVTYPQMNIEAIMPLGNTTAKLSICRARMTSVGKNLPCVAPEWINTLFTYSSRFSDGRNDRAILNIPKVCNKEDVNNADEDLMRLELDIKVDDHEGLVDGAKEWISAGNMYSTTKIWVGQLAIILKTPATISPTTAPYISMNRNSSFTTVPIGMPIIYSLLIKVHPGESIDLKIDAESTTPGLSICGLRLKEVGDNFPCVKTTIEPTYTAFSNNVGNTQASLNMSIVTNTGTTTVASNDYFDSNALIFEVIVKLSSETTLVPDTTVFPFKVDVTTSTGGVATSLSDNVQATYNTSGFDSAVTQSGSFAFSVGEISGNDTDDSVAKGEGKRFIVDLTLPETNTQKITVSFITPVQISGQIEICDAAVIAVGSHFPCIDKTRLFPTFQSRTGSLYNDIVTIDLGYVCSSAVNVGVDSHNKIQIEAVARVLPDALLNDGDVVFFHVTVNTNDALIYVAQMNLTITDTFVEKQSPTLFNNDTILMINTTSPTTMTVGEVVTFPLVMNIPAMSVSNVIVDVSLPINGTAVAIVKDIRLISAGKNIKCLYENTTKNVAFHPVYNSSLDNCQNDKGYIDFGIVTNAGLSYRRENAESNDNAVNVEVDIILSDNEITDNGAGLKFSFGAKLGSYIFIVDHDITVSRTGLEYPILKVDAVVNETLSSSTNIVVEATLQHDENSTALATNASVLFYIPPYMVHTNVVVNTSTYTTNYENGIVIIEFDNVLLCDVISISLTLASNTSMTVPEDVTTDRTVVSYQAGTYMFPRAGSSFTADDFFTTELQQVNFTISVIRADVCDGSLGMEDGRIDDCQILSSVEDDPARPSFHGRVNGTSAWSPFKRGKLFDNLRFFQVYFGNKTKVTKILVQHKSGFTHYPTKLTLTYSDDGFAWQNGEIVSIVVPFSETIVYPTRLVDAVYIRIYITEDNSNGVAPDLAVKFGLFGCHVTSDAPTDICSMAPKRSHPTDFYERSFGVGNGKVIVCDVNPKVKNSPSMCHSSTTGSEWTRLSSILASVIGYDSEDNKWFGYGIDKSTTVVSLDGGQTWQSASRETYLTSRDKTSFQFTKRVPWLTTNLDNPSTPHSDYQISGWGATYNGMMQGSSGSWTGKLEWEQCCV